MSAVMLSIRPEWCEKILNGEKTIEVRKTRPKLETPFKCYIYCTMNLKRVFVGEYSGLEEAKTAYACGKVIGEFVCNEMYTYFNVTTDNWESLLGNCHENEKEQLTRKALLSESQVHKYANGKNLYGWHISDLVIYDKPKELSQFFVESNATTDYPMLKQMTRPPQSWCYVEERKK